MRLQWEYKREEVDVSALEDPPNSREPMVTFFRRPVGDWEVWTPTGETAPHWVKEDTPQ